MLKITNVNTVRTENELRLRRDLVKWSASLIVDAVNGGVVVKQYLHAGGALRIVCVADAVVERSETARVLVVCRRTEIQQCLDTQRHHRCNKCHNCFFSSNVKKST